MAGLTHTTAQELAATYRLTEEQLSIKVNHELFAHIIKHMNDWSEIAPHLGLNSADRELIEEKSDLSQQRLYMLEKWKQKSGREATFFKLVEGFLRAERRDLAEKVLKFFKEKEAKSGKSEIFETPPLLTSSILYPLEEENYDQCILPGELHPGTVETRLGPGDQPTVPNETSSLLEISTTQPIALQRKKPCPYICFPCILLFSFLLACISVTFIVLQSTVYDINKVPPHGAVHVIKDVVVLLGDFNPFYVGHVSATSKKGTTNLYKIRCHNLTKYVYNQTIEHSKNLNVTTNKTYSLLEQYLLEGSELDLNFEFVSNHSHLKQDCLGEVYVFDNFVYYDQFLQYGTGTAFAKEQYCLQNKTSSYSLKADETRYYLIGLDLQEPSTLEHIEFEVSGHKLYYDLSSYQPHCTTSPQQLEQCRIRFERQNYRDSRNNICILGKTHEDSSQVTYEVGRSAVIVDAGSTLLTLGIAGITFAIMIIPLALVIKMKLKECSTY